MTAHELATKLLAMPNIEVRFWSPIELLNSKITEVKPLSTIPNQIPEDENYILIM